MHWKCIVLVCLLASVPGSFSRPRSESILTETEIESNEKEWQSKKSESSLIKRLEKSGVGAKRNVGGEEGLEIDGGNGIEIVDSPKVLTESKPSGEVVRVPEIPAAVEDESATRIKKQSPNNVCIKVGGCGKTMCGSVVSARGPIVGDVTAMMQAAKSVSGFPNLQSSAANDPNPILSRASHFSPLQGRTFDTLSPLSYAYGGSQLGSPSYSASLASSSSDGTNALGYGHSFFKPQLVPAVPVAVISQHQPHPLLHPWLLSHLMPHLMPHVTPGLMPGLASFGTPHKYDLQQHYQEPPTNEIKQPVPVAVSLPAISHYSYGNADNAMICQPIRNQRIDHFYEYAYKPDVAADKSLNVSETAKNSRSAEEDSRIQDHIRKVNEIKEEIGQLNRAAQRIVDQQERLTQMQQKSLWGGSGGAAASSSSSASASSMHGPGSTSLNQPYMGSGYYTHPSMPWGYSRSNILSYPNSQNDIEFFLNLLRAGRKFGVVSDAFQQMPPGVGEMIKGVAGAVESDQGQKQTTENANVTKSRQENGKTNQTVKST